jgi:hypothetical protein
MNILQEAMKHEPEEILTFWRDWGMEVDTSNDKELELALQFFLMTHQQKKTQTKENLINSINKYR